MFKDGVRYYTTGKAIVPVHFPEDQVICRWCPFCRSEQDLNRYWCRLTNSMIYAPNECILPDCPIEFEKDDESEQ